MKPIRSQRTSLAFTRLELIVTVGVLGLLIFLIIPALAQAKGKAKRTSCLNNLRNVGLFIRISRTGGSAFSPVQSALDPEAPGDEYFKTIVALTNEVQTPWWLSCPADTRRPVREWASFSREHASYFLGSPSQIIFPRSIMAGDRNLTTNGVLLGPGRVELALSQTNVSWDGKDLHRTQGNLLMGDGSVQQLSGPRLRQLVGTTGLATNVWIFP
jgi:type II secretory pathway pseudopilin PulG